MKQNKKKLKTSFKTTGNLTPKELNSGSTR